MTTAKSSSQPSAISSPSEQVVSIPVEQLFVSPEETRKTIDQDALLELAASIRKHGVQEALIVRPIDLDCMSGKPLPGAAKVGDAYEIVAGQRRWLASKLADKTTVPCVVRKMSDDEAAEQRINSNLQRKDLAPMEEAEGYAKLLDRPGATVETVAATLAKLPSYIGRRLKLLEAIEPVREALKASAIEVGHALELSRLSEPQQVNLLNWLDVGYNGSSLSDEEDEDEFDEGEGEDERGVCKYCGCTEDDPCMLKDGTCSWVNAEQTVCSNPDCVAQMGAGEPEGLSNEIRWKPARFTVAQLRSAIVNQSLKVLSDAPFRLDDEIPPMSCVECPKRSGNAALLFEDCAQDTCTDRPCFDAKVKVWIKAQLDAADAEKRKLLMLSDGYSSKPGVIDKWHVVVVPDQKPVKPCLSQEDAIWINGERAGHETMICRDPKCKIHSKLDSSMRSVDPVKKKADRKKLLDKLNAEKKYRAALFKAVAVAPIPESHAQDLNLEVCLYALGRAPGQYSKKTAEALGWPEDIFGWNGAKQLRETVLKLTPAERLRGALVAAHSGELGVNEFSSTSKPEDLEKLASLLGLDLKKIRAEACGKPEAPVKKAEVQHKAAPKPAKKKPAKKAAAKPAPKKAVGKPAAKKSAKKAAKKTAKK